MNTSGVLKQLFAVYPNAKISDATIAMYVRILQDIPADELQVVVDQAVCNSNGFLPDPGQLRKLYKGFTSIGRQSYSEAWESVQRAIRGVGSYGVPKFQNDFTATAVRRIGWKELCASENKGNDLARFRDIYNDLVAREDYDQNLLPATRELADKMIKRLPTAGYAGLLVDTEGKNEAD